MPLSILQSIRESQTAIENLSKLLQQKSNQLKSCINEFNFLEQELHKLEQTLCDKRIESIQIVEKYSSLTMILENERKARDELDEVLKDIEKEIAETQDENTEYQMIFCRRLVEIQREYIREREELLKPLLNEFALPSAPRSGDEVVQNQSTDKDDQSNVKD